MDFIIIGGGALGLATAEALLRQGARVTLLERTETGRESSWAGGGILSPLCPWDYPETVTQLSLRGAAKFGAWASSLHEATGIDPEFTLSGMQILPPFDSACARAWCVAHQLPFETTVTRAGESILLPTVAQVRNPRLLQALRARVLQLGGTLVERCEVRQIMVDNMHIHRLITSQGEYRAGRYILAAGAWSQTLLGEHAGEVAIKPIRGQMLLFKFDAPPLPHILLHNGLYLIPRRDGHLLVGSTLEDAGFDKSTSEKMADELRQRAENLLPSLRHAPLVKHWAGLRPGSPHNIPTIGRHPVLHNFFINSGHFRYGVTMAPASVEILMNELNHAEQPFDVSAYRP